MTDVLIAGCGYVGTALGIRLATEGYVVWGLRRRTGLLPPSIRPFAADLTLPETLRTLPPGVQYVFYTAAADRSDDEAYRAVYVDGLRNLLEAMESQGQQPQRVFFTSSTAVYAQVSGEWVDEMSPAQSEHFSGRRLLEGEQLLLGSRFPATVLRLGGIYGPGRARLIESVRQGLAAYPEGPPVYANRIHRDDCVGSLCHLMTLPQPAHLYLGVDHHPADQCAVLRWLAAQLSVPPPRTEGVSGFQERSQRSNKRCSNARLVASGHVFRFPTFREGYRALLAEQTQ